MSASASIRTFGIDELQSCETLFPPEVDRDPWVQYHATSSISEQQIDAEGLLWSASTCSASEVLEVVRVYRSMNWCGLHSGGYVVLDSFTAAGDFQGRETKPIYFREYSLRSLIYAKRDFAGGESARAVRYALRDLERYLSEQSIREEHYAYQHRCAVNLSSTGAIPNPVIRVDLEWLGSQLSRFSDLRQRCDTCEASHQYGVVYAVRLTLDDIPSLNFSDSMGLRCYKHVTADRIVEKVHVHADTGRLPKGNDYRLVQQNEWRYADPTGLLATLKLAETEGRAYPLAVAHDVFRHRGTDLIDPSAGTDDSEEIARKYGPP